MGEEKQQSHHDAVLSERKKKFLGIFRNSAYLAIAYIVILLLLTLYTWNVRTSNVSYLKDISSGNYTLGPDLDPFLFLRWSKYIAEHGSLYQIDPMRYHPLGFDTSRETATLPYLIVGVYHALRAFNPVASVELAAILYPAIAFSLAVIMFFFFVRRVFRSYHPYEQNTIALLATMFFLSMPEMLHRTVAGIPEKEAGGVLLMFLSFYVFLVSIQAKTMRNAIFFGVLSGVATGLLGLVWGAVTYAFISIALAAFVYCAMRTIDGKGLAAYLSWVAAVTLVLGFTTLKYGGVIGLISSTTSGFAYLVAAIMVLDMLIGKTVYKQEKKIPRIVFSIGAALVLGVLAALLINPVLLERLFSDIQTGLLHPIGTDRITLTVAENSQPYFSAWKGNFGINFFWLFFAASVIIFYETAKDLRKRDKYILTAAYTLFMLGTIFSRYSPQSIMNGTSPLSQLVYFGSFALLAGTFAVIYYKDFRNNEMSRFKTISKELIFLLILFFWAAVSARGAIRLFFLLAPITAILAGFITVYITNKAFMITMKKEEQRAAALLVTLILFELVKFFVPAWNIALAPNMNIMTILQIIAFVTFIAYHGGKGKFLGSEKESTMAKVLLLCAAVLIIYIASTSLFSFARATAGEAEATRPGIYNYQWQLAMDWVRKSTPETAVFSHWWDYGYWIQTLGERATMLDGGNSIGYWNYLMGRYVLTGQTETEALEVLYAHNVTHLLIDSTDIGKYPAYASIGSDLDYDRYNFATTVLLDDRQTQETRNETIIVYPMGTIFEENFIWYDKNTKQQILFQGQNADEAVLAGILLPIAKDSNTTGTLQQAQVVAYYKGRSERIDIPICTTYYNGELLDYKEKGPCIPGTFYIMPRLDQQGNSIAQNPLGAGIWLNPRAMRTRWVNLFLLNQSSESFRLVHTESNIYIQQLRQQGMQLPEFVYLGDVLGPIKIWEIHYPSNVTFRPEYLNTSYPDMKLTIAK